MSLAWFLKKRQKQPIKGFFHSGGGIHPPPSWEPGNSEPMGDRVNIIYTQNIIKEYQLYNTAIEYGF